MLHLFEVKNQFQSGQNMKCSGALEVSWLLSLPHTLSLSPYLFPFLPLYPFLSFSLSQNASLAFHISVYVLAKLNIDIKHVQFYMKIFTEPN